MIVREGESPLRSWLTGFDAPCLHTMYADKPMQGHGLMQAGGVGAGIFDPSGDHRGIPAGAVCAGLVQSFFAAYGEGWQVLVYGALGGAGAGLLIALTLDFLSRRVSAWASLQLASGKALPEAVAPRKL